MHRPKTVEQLSAARPHLPHELNDRAQDAWEPLLAIADAAGDVWPVLARAAAIALHEAAADYAEEALELLALGHVRDAFQEFGEDKLATSTLLEALVRRDDGPWAEWWGQDVQDGKPISAARRLRQLLDTFGVKPKQLRLGERNVRGYDKADFADSWDRYLPPGTATPATSATPLASTVALVADVGVPSGNGEAEALHWPEPILGAEELDRCKRSPSASLCGCCGIGTRGHSPMGISRSSATYRPSGSRLSQR
jgi:uncharacterized protein DUF3631